METSAGIIYPNMYILLVGPPSTGKDQAIIPARKLWERTRSLNIAPISMTGKGMLDALADPKALRQFSAKEKKVFLTYQSLLVCVPEFGVLLPAYDLQFISILNELWACGDIFEERLRGSGETFTIEKPHVHIMAGTQPKFLGEFFPDAAFGMGFTSRIIMIYAGEPVRKGVFAKRKSYKSMENKLLSDMKRMTQLYGEVEFTYAAQEYIEEWHMDLAEEEAPTHSKLQQYNGRRLLHLLKLSIVFSVSDSDQMVVDLPHVKRAHLTLLEAERVMPEIFKEMTYNSQMSEIEEAFYFIMREYSSKNRPVPEHRVTHFLMTKVPANQIQFILDSMIRSKIISVVKTKGLSLESARAFIPEQLGAIE